MSHKDGAAYLTHAIGAGIDLDEMKPQDDFRFSELCRLVDAQADYGNPEVAYACIKPKDWCILASYGCGGYGRWDHPPYPWFSAMSYEKAASILKLLIVLRIKRQEETEVSIRAREALRAVIDADAAVRSMTLAYPIKLEWADSHHAGCRVHLPSRKVDFYSEDEVKAFLGALSRKKGNGEVYD
jgi:hypothetical protein